MQPLASCSGHHRLLNAPRTTRPSWPARVAWRGRQGVACSARERKKLNVELPANIFNLPSHWTPDSSLDDHDHYVQPWDSGEFESGEQPGKRPIFNAERWRQHKKTTRYIRHLMGLASSRTMRSLAKPILTLSGLTTIYCTYQESLQQGLLPPYFPSIMLPDEPFNLTSFALALLLVFRTDTSYERWSEAHGIWRRVRSSSQNLTRDALTWVKDDRLRSMLLRWNVAFALALQEHIRESSPSAIETALATVLTEQEARAAAESHSPPHYTLAVLTNLIQRTNISDVREEKLLAAVVTFSECVTASEGILRYPIPLSCGFGGGDQQQRAPVA